MLHFAIAVLNTKSPDGHTGDRMKITQALVFVFIFTGISWFISNLLFKHRICSIMRFGGVYSAQSKLEQF